MGKWFNASFNLESVVDLVGESGDSQADWFLAVFACLIRLCWR